MIAPTRVAAVIALAVAIPLAGCGGDDGGTAGGSEPSVTTALKGMVRTPPLQVGDIELPDESPEGRGEPFAMKADEGGLLLVYFGYTSCPDICPTTLADIGAALRGMTDDREKIDVAMVTFDPERDTGEVISSYLDHFVDGGHALRTENPALQQSAQDAFHVVARRVDEEDRYDFEHTAITYVIDESGTVPVEWPFGTAPEDMRSDIEQLLDRATAAGNNEETP